MVALIINSVAVHLLVKFRARRRWDNVLLRCALANGRTGERTSQRDPTGRGSQPCGGDKKRGMITDLGIWAFGRLFRVFLGDAEGLCFGI